MNSKAEGPLLILKVYKNIIEVMHDKYHEVMKS